jgi:hypothetical protein
MRNVDGQDLLFPFHEGRILLETVSQLQDILSRTDVDSHEDLVISVEILNGTTNNGLAARTAQIFKSYGYNIVSVSNADRDDYRNTVIIDRRGNMESAEKAADLINCERIHTDLYPGMDESVDVTVILGKDFDGRYVK